MRARFFSDWRYLLNIVIYFRNSIKQLHKFDVPLKVNMIVQNLIGVPCLISHVYIECQHVLKKHLWNSALFIHSLNQSLLVQHIAESW